MPCHRRLRRRIRVHRRSSAVTWPFLRLLASSTLDRCRSGGFGAASMPSALARLGRVHPRLNNRVSRATPARPDFAPGPTHHATGAIFDPARDLFHRPMRGRASRHPTRHAPLSPLPAHPGERAPRPPKPRSNSVFFRRPKTGLLLVRISACLLPRGSGAARTRGDRRRVTGASATVVYEPRSR